MTWRVNFPDLVNFPKTTPTEAKLSRLIFEALLAMASLYEDTNRINEYRRLLPVVVLPHVIDSIFVETEDVRFITSVNQKGDISTDTKSSG